MVRLLPENPMTLPSLLTVLFIAIAHLTAGDAPGRKMKVFAVSDAGALVADLLL
jgi:hypothetical protein